MKRLFNARVLLTFGLVSLVSSAMMLTFFLGVLPDKGQLVREQRLSISELIASSTMDSLVSGDTAAVQNLLAFSVQRNPDLRSAALRQADGQLVAISGEHEILWEPRADNRSTETQVVVPLFGNTAQWGQVELSFEPIRGEGLLAYVMDERLHAALALSLFCLVGFYFYLGRMLKHLDPSRAVPDRVRSALDSLAESLLLVDAKGQIVLANQSFASLVNESQEKLLGRKAVQFAWITGDGTPMPAGELPWLISQSTREALRNLPIALIDGSGQKRSFLANCSPIMGDADTVNGVLVSLDDVTELERKEVLLREATDKALAANQAKSEFLANMSHEIRTPMNAVLGFTELIRRGSATSQEQSRRYLDTIHRNGKHLLDLINDILDLSKVESGEFATERIACEPHRIAAETIEILHVRAQEKGITLSLDVQGSVPRSIAGDPARLRQILTNLTGNAIKFTEKGSVTIRERWLGDAHGGRLELSIIDSGIGIPQDKLASIFEPFTQAESSTTRRFGGTGLGLTISRRFARAMGGDIEVTSIIGQGSTFTVRLPVDQADEHHGPLELIAATDALASTEQQAGPAQTSWRFTDCRILVADDSPENRQLVNVLLSEVGITVTEAEDGRQACDKARQGDFDLVLMDMQMPVLDGYSATRELREAGLSIPIIAFTAHALTGFDKEIREAGCDGYLTKPIDIDAMFELLGSHLNGERVTHAQAATDPRTIESARPPDAAPVTPDADGPLVSRLAGQQRLHAIVDSFVVRLPERIQQMREALAEAIWPNWPAWPTGSRVPQDRSGSTTSRNRRCAWKRPPCSSSRPRRKAISSRSSSCQSASNWPASVAHPRRMRALPPQRARHESVNEQA
ncbi:MAG: ATP-binding protein [Burkholderiaceae bacterium]